MIPLALTLGYLLGSIPFGLVITKAAGLGDIRAIGSGNIGATNVLRTGRKTLAAATLLLDGLKAFAAVWIARSFAPEPVALMTGVAAVIGHILPAWLRFRGGKGVASGIGALIGFAWPLGGLVCLIWLVLAYASHRSSVSALAAFTVAPMIAGLTTGPATALASAAIAALIWVRHHQNIRRLLAGTEPKIGQVG